MCRDCLVGIVTRYELDGPDIEFRWGRHFPVLSKLALGPTQLPIKQERVSFLGVKRPGRGVHHPPPSGTEAEKRVELYLCSAFGTSWPVLGRTLPKIHLADRGTRKYKGPTGHKLDREAFGQTNLAITLYVIFMKAVYKKPNSLCICNARVKQLTIFTVRVLCVNCVYNRTASCCDLRLHRAAGAS